MDSVEELSQCVKRQNWDVLVNNIKPKYFCKEIPRSLNDFIQLLYVAEILTRNDIDLDNKLKVVLLKCLGNSCVNGYLQMSYLPNHQLNDENVYTLILQKASNWNEQSSYNYSTHFPYDGVVRWTIAVINKYSVGNKKSVDNQKDILRLSLQFLCNFCTFAYKISSLETNGLTHYLLDKNLNNSVINLVGHDDASLATAACVYVYNNVKQLLKTFYESLDKQLLTSQLIKSIISDIQAALDAIVILLRQPNYLRETYNDLNIDDKLYLLDIIHQEARNHIYNQDGEKSILLPPDAVEFLTDQFKKKSDLILKTVDSYLKDIEPTEVTILLDILGVLTSNDCDESNQLKKDKSLFINCIFLLKSIHMAGKECQNNFTPIENLSKMTLKDTENCCGGNQFEEKIHLCSKKIQSHPAFGFKAALIRVLGNLVHEHKDNQTLIRELDGIPLILDSCNIDARNPLIIQWATLTIRNVCKDNRENQEIIRNMTKIGVIDNALIKEFGITLSEEKDGNAIGIVPLLKDSI